MVLQDSSEKMSTHWHIIIILSRDWGYMLAKNATSKNHPKDILSNHFYVIVLVHRASNVASHTFR